MALIRILLFIFLSTLVLLGYTTSDGRVISFSSSSINSSSSLDSVKNDSLDLEFSSNSLSARSTSVPVVTEPTPFNCSTNAYVFSSSAYNAQTDSHGFDLSTGTKTSTQLNINTGNINAIGYNITDNFIWGYDRKNYKVVKVGSNYEITSYDINGLPSFSPADDGNHPTYHVGDVSQGGILHLATISDPKTIYRVDVNPLSANYLKALPSINVSQDMYISDFAFSPIDNLLYAVDFYNNLIKIDQNTGTVTTLKSLSLPNQGNVASVFFDKNGNLYAHHSKNGDIHKIATPHLGGAINMTYFSTIGNSNHGDGARCSGAAVVHPDAPTMSVSNQSITEGDSGTTDLEFTIILDKSSSTDITFDYQIVDGNGSDITKNAIAPSDYTSSSSVTSATISANSTSYTISVPVKGDTEAEDNETFSLVLSNIEGADIDNESAIGTIINDDQESSICDGRSYGINYKSNKNYSAIYEITNVGTSNGSMTTTHLKEDAFPFKSISLTKALDNKLYTVSSDTVSAGNRTPIYVYDPSNPSVQAINTGISLPYPGKNLWWISGGLDPDGHLYFMLKDGSYLVKVDLKTSTVSTVWSTWPTTSVQALGGENFGELSVNIPSNYTLFYDITFESNGDALITDADGHYVWKVLNVNSNPTVVYQGKLSGMSSISDPQWINDAGTIRLYGSDANTPDGTHYINTSTWDTTKVGSDSFYDMASCDFSILTPQQATGTIKGTVYIDANNNSSYDLGVEDGIGSITVSLYNANTLINSTTTDTDGSYRFDNVNSSLSYNIKVDNSDSDLPNDYDTVGTSNPLTNVTVAENEILRNQDFGFIKFTMPPSPQTCGLVATSIMPSGDRYNAGNGASVVAFDYSERGTTNDLPEPVELASAKEVGTVWGKAYNGSTKKLYTSAFLRRHADLSPDGLGAIYEIDINTKTPTLWMNLNSKTHLGSSATLFPYETAANRGLSSPFAPSHDVWAYNRVGKQGLAGLDLSDDFRTMYAMDLTNRQLLAIDTTSKSVTNRYPITNPGCAGGAGDVRPFGVDYLKGNVYIGVTCSGETNSNYRQVDTYVMKLVGNSFQTVVDSAKGYRWSDYWSSDPYVDPSRSCNDKPKMNTYTPIITNMELDENNNMVIGVMGINGFRFATNNYAPDASCSTLTGGHESRGWVLHATPSGSNWVLDADEEFDTGNLSQQKHFFRNGQFAHWGSGSTHTYVGGMAMANCGEKEVVAANIMDPLDYETMGTRYMRTADGEHETATSSGDISYATSKTSTRELIRGTKTSWEKSAGLGDIEFLNDVSVPPTESRPIAEYRFDECSWSSIADEVKDSSGNDLDGISKNGTTTNQDAQIERSGLFIKNNQNYLDFGDNFDVNGNSFSISVWFKSKSTNGEQIIYNKENLYELAVKDGYLQYAFQPHWAWDGGQSFRVEEDTWYHAVITYDGTKQRVYKDGVEVFSRNQSGDIGTNEYHFLVGARNSNTPKSFFDGNIDELKIYTNTLDATQVKALYHNEKSKKNSDGTDRTEVVCSIPTDGTCYALSTTGNLYTTYLNPNGTPLPEASQQALDFSTVPVAQMRDIDGQAGAYYAKDGLLYTFAKTTDNKLYFYSIDPSNGKVTYIKEFNNLKSDVGGAAFGKENFYVVARTSSALNDGTLYTIDPSDWSISSTNVLNGDITMLSALAISKEGVAYGLIDNHGGLSKLYSLDLHTAKVSHKINLPNVDGRHIGAEGLSFADDGELYVENSDVELSVVDDKIYQINVETGALTPAAQMPNYLNPRLDIQSLSCNVEVIKEEVPPSECEPKEFIITNWDFENGSYPDVPTGWTSQTRSAGPGFHYRGDQIANNEGVLMLGADAETWQDIDVSSRGAGTYLLTYYESLHDYAGVEGSARMKFLDASKNIISQSTVETITSKYSDATKTLEGPKSITAVAPENTHYIRIFFEGKGSFGTGFAKIDKVTLDYICEESQEPFTCDETTYLFQDAPTDPYGFDLSTGTMTKIAEDPFSDTINGIGYNTKDNFIWGSATNRFGYIVKIDKNMNSKAYEVENLTTKGYAGDVSLDGKLYLSHKGKEDILVTAMNVIELNASKANYMKAINIPLSENINPQDWAFSPIDSQLYFVASQTSQLYKIDPSNGNVTLLGTLNIDDDTNQVYGAQYFDKYGNLYAYDNNSGKTYKINVSTVQGEYFSTSNISTLNDGARCPNAEVEQPNTPAPLAQYRFDECEWDGTANEVKDSVGTRHGTAINGTITDGSTKKVGRSGHFTSNDSHYVNIDGFDDVFGNTNSAFTITTWLKANSLSTAETNHKTKNTFIAKASDSKNDNLEIGVNPDGTIHVYIDSKIKNVSGGQDTHTDFGVAGDITTNNWHFVAVTYDNGTVTVKIDNKIYSNSSKWAGSTNIDQAVGSPLTIGSSIHIDNYFDGYMDEVAIFDTALSTDELNSIYNNEATGKNTDGTSRPSVICGVPPTLAASCESGVSGTGNYVAGWWHNSPNDTPMSNRYWESYPNDIKSGKDDTIIDEAFDETHGSGLQATIANSYLNIKGVNQSTLDGAIQDNDYVEYKFTTADFTGTKYISNYVFTVANGHQSRYYPYKFSILTSDTEDFSSRLNTLVDAQHKGYTPGAVDNPNTPGTHQTYEYNPTEFMLLEPNKTYYIRVYVYDDQSGGSDGIMMDDFNFGVDCCDGCNKPTKLVAEYRFDECDFNGLTVKDSSENNLTGTIFNERGEVLSEGSEKVINRSAKFEQGVIYRDVPNGLLDYSEGAQTTVSLWMKWDGTYDSGENYAWGVSPFSWGSYSGRYSLYIQSNGMFGFNTVQGDVWGVDYTNYANEWHHIVAVFYNGDVQKSKLYIDGVLQSSTQHGTPNQSNSYIRSRLSIGGKTDTTPRYHFRDYIDEVKIFTGELNENKIQEIYNNEKSGKNWDSTDRASIICASEPFVCTDTLFVSNRSELGTGSTDSGQTWLHSINQNKTPYDFSAIGTGYTSVDGGYNALGYNIQDNFMYGLYKNTLVKIDKNGVVQELGAVSGLNTGQLYAGEFDRNGFYYVSGEGGDSSKIYKIDINTKSVVDTIILHSGSKPKAVRFWDMAIDITGQYFYVMLVKDGDSDSDYNNDQLAKINISTGAITLIGEDKSNMSSYISLIFSDKFNNLYMMSNENGFYQINTLTGEHQLISSTQNLTFYNDGTSCPDAEIFKPATMYVSNEEVTEGNSGTKNLTFTIALDKAGGVPISFDYQVFDGNSTTLRDNATSPEDYTGMNSVTSVNLNGTTQTYEINISVNGDTKIENDETFTIVLSNVQGAILGNMTAVGTILNDDIDLDSDDDGILDIDEGLARTVPNNAGLEEPIIPNKTYKVFDAGSVPAWNTSSSDNKIEIWSSGFLDVPADTGKQFAELNAHQVGSIYQDITTIPGTVLTWNIAHRGRSGIDVATVSIGSTTNLSVVKTMSDGNSAWGHYSGTYTVPEGQTTTRFSFDSVSASGGSPSIGNFIDSFTISWVNLDSDSDGIPNYLDLDSDNDGIPDNIEAQTTQDYIQPNKTFDENGVDTAYTGGLTPVDTDGDGTVDVLDLNSDNDTLFDIEESGLGNNDANNDGRTDDEVGSNGLDNANSEFENNYEDVNGFIYENDKFMLQDSDEDMLQNGSNAAPMRTDFDYRDNYVDPLSIEVHDLEQREGDVGETKFIIPVKLNKPAPKGGIIIEYTPSGEQVYKNDFADLQVQEFFEDDPNEASRISNIIDGNTESDMVTVPTTDYNPRSYEVQINAIGLPEITEGNAGATATLSFKLSLNKKAHSDGITVQVSPQNLTATEGEDFTRNTSSIYFAPGEQAVNINYMINGDDTFEEDETFKVRIHNPINAVLHGSRTSVIGTILNDDEDSSTGSYTQNNTSYRRYWYFWTTFEISYWKYSKYFSDKYSSYEEYYIEELGRTPNEKYPLITEKTQEISKNQKNVSAKPSIQDAVATQHKLDGLEPLLMKIPEGETEGNITIYVQGDTSYEPNEPFTLSLTTPNNASFIDLNTSGSKIESKTNSAKPGDPAKKIIIVIINDDRKPVVNIAEYRFDCLNRNKYTDYSPQANDIRTTLASTKRPNSSILCNAIDAYPVSGLTIKDHDAYHEDNGTLSFWMYDNTSVSNTEKAISKGSFSIGFKANASATIGQVEVLLADGTQLLSNRTYDATNPEWIFVTVTYAKGGKVQLYMDGVLEGEAAYDDSFDNSSDINVAQYSGYLDEFYMFNRDMSVDEINALYTQQKLNINLDGNPRNCGCVDLEPSITADYRFDACYWDGSPNEVLDSSGNGLHLNALNAVQPQLDGKINNAPVFDFNQTQIEGAVSIPLDNEVSINTWIKTKQNQAPGGNYVRLIEMSKAGSSNHSTTLAYSPDGKTLRGWTTNEDNNRSSTVSSDLEANNIHDEKWHMITLTYNDGTTSLYIDGSLEATSIKDIGDLADINTISIGSGSNQQNHFSGSIDETLIFNQALTPSEISSIFTNTNGAKNWDGSDRNATSCVYPDVRINDISEKEGDTGNTTFRFTVTLSSQSAVDTQIAYTLNDGTATIADNDYIADSNFINFRAGETSQDIEVEVVGDYQMEYDETFTVDLSSPTTLLTIIDNQGLGTIINDDVVSFAVERTDSKDFVAPLNAYDYQQKREFYTQITNTDFDYSVVSYDKNRTSHYETGIKDVTLKVELLDHNSSTINDVLYTTYVYFDNTEKSRLILDSDKNDLKIAQATRHAAFRVTALLDANGSLLYGQYDNEADFTRSKNTLSGGEKTGGSDAFAIRPLAYRVKIEESDTAFPNTIYKVNDDDTTAVNLAAEYDYKLHIDAIMDSLDTVANTYKTLRAEELNATLTFEDKLSCNDTSSINNLAQRDNYGFSLGSLNDEIISHDNVGKYSFQITDINWTDTDKDSSGDPQLSGCILNSSSNQLINGRYGCNFSSNTPHSTNHDPITIEFEAYEFNLTNTRLENLNNNGEKHIYMGDLSLSQHMGINLFTDIIAQGKNHTPLTNFTSSCVAKPVNLNLNYLISTQSTDNNTSYPPLMTKNNTAQSFKRMISVNGGLPSMSETTHLDDGYSLLASDFLDTNEGNSSINILYNISKELNETMNPVHLNLLNIEANATQSIFKLKGEDSVANQADNTGEVANGERYFYYSRVAPDMENYPESPNFSQLTPLGVELYCDLTVAWCSNILPSELGLNSKHTKYGWYTARKHNSLTDGTINALVPDNPDVSISPSDTNLSSIKGRYDNVFTNYEGNALDDDTTPRIGVEVIVNVDPWLRYHEDILRAGHPFYRVNFKNPNLGIISGIGATGNTLNMKANDKAANRLSW
ncbi:MAG: Conserved repeat domain protein [uncultured Sulfurovum sp.]|uniref:Conserved repeat domain protein n=1 Tax=uncultured Sulfurovum sp. TaxID=269237 RepID=A0A6S6TQU0_9BACT|nr:MAG: Conserved repeat domain protein [uncultured Sulfurovum sp.]